MGSVSGYRQGQKTRGEATRELVGFTEDHHRGNPGIPRRELDDALGDYLALLNDHDRDRAAALQAGGAGPNLDHGQIDEAQPDLAARPPVRGRDDEGEEDGPRKRQAIDALMQFPAGPRGAIPEDLQQTLDAVRAFANDPAYAKGRVLDATAKPEFPAALWSDVISNSYVDLDRVFDFHYTVDGGGKRLIQRIGDLQLVSDSPKVDKHVRTSGDWTIAWAKYRAAVLFVFPHRQYELDKYGAHIESSFLSNPLVHDRVLLYDRRVRTRAAESGLLRLCDTTEFFSDFNYFVLSPGPVQRGSSGGGRARATAGQRNQSSDICRRFNFGTCRDAASCKYQHVCIRCQKEGHSLNTCPNGRQSSDGGAGKHN
jgi:hypothetical protein